MASKNKYVKIALAVLFLLCLADFPYGFYQLVRFIGSIGLGYLAYSAYQQENKVDLIAFGALALLFQPFAKITLGRELWNIIDVGAAIYLIISLFKAKPKTNS